MLFGGAFVVEGSCSASPLILVFSLIVFFTAAHVTAGAGGVGKFKSAAEHAVATLSGYAAIGLAALRVVAIASAVSVAAGGESCSPATCGEFWAFYVLTNVVFSAASLMSADAGAALGEAEALGLVVVPITMSVFLMFPFAMYVVLVFCSSQREDRRR